MRAPRLAFPLAFLLVLTAALTAAAQQDGSLPPPPANGFDLVTNLVRPLILAAVFTVMGVALFVACIWAVVRVSPFSVQKEIEEDQNVALGLILGSMILGIAIILAAALVG